MLGVPLLLLHDAAPQSRTPSGGGSAAAAAAATAPAGRSGGTPNWQLTRFRGAKSGTGATSATTTTAPPVTTTSSTTSTTVPAPTTTTPTTEPRAPQVVRTVVTSPPARPVTSTTTAPPVTSATSATSVATHSEVGLATWYAAASPGSCASPTLPFGTVMTVTNVATGSRTTCVVDDREAANPGRVVDMSPSGFSAIAALSKGVVTVSVTW
jgi:rare lipoprotein A (peptidoglycan hydrolase)